MKEKQFDVVCFGFGCVDVLIEGFPSAENFENNSIGKGMVRVKSSTVSPGGDALNEATVLSKLGNKVKLVCAAGNDDLRAVIEKRGRDVGFDTSDLGTTNSGKTLLSIVLMQGNGQHTFLSNGEFENSVYEPNFETVKSGRIVSLASMFVPPLNVPEAVVHAAKTAKDAGAIVCADCGFPRHGTLNPDFIPAFQYIDYFFPNEDEILGMTGKENVEEAADVLLEYGVKNVIAKIGKRGCILCNKDGKVHVPAYTVKAVDSTGAGDNFAAGFIHSLLRGKTPPECCKFATGVSAVSVQHVGASVGVQSLEQVEKAIEGFEKGACESI